MLLNVILGNFQGEFLGPVGHHMDAYANYWNPLPETVDAFITSDLPNGIIRSWKPDCPVLKADLAYVQFPHWNFEKKMTWGELIVHKDVVQDICQIFGTLMDEQFPIEKAYLIDNYDADDERSMQDNNTSAFCSRAITAQPGVFSNHSYGLAIDINPFINPYFNKDKNLLAPQGSDAYLDRGQVVPGMIQKGDICHQAFVKRGWIWGGDCWANRVDYQHFATEH